MKLCEFEHKQLENVYYLQINPTAVLSNGPQVGFHTLQRMKASQRLFEI